MLKGIKNKWKKFRLKIVQILNKDCEIYPPKMYTKVKYAENKCAKWKCLYSDIKKKPSSIKLFDFLVNNDFILYASNMQYLKGLLMFNIL